MSARPRASIGMEPGLHRRHVRGAPRDLAPLDEQLADRGVGIAVLAGISEPNRAAVRQTHHARPLHLHVEQLDRVIEIEQLEAAAIERAAPDLGARVIRHLAAAACRESR